MKAKSISFVATKKPGAARKFYQDTLGLKFISDDPFAIVFEVNGTMLRVQKVKELVPAGHTVLGWEVADIRKEVEGLTVKGVKFEVFPGMGQDELGIWSAPSGAKVAWFRDPDGNVLSLTEFGGTKDTK
jgi:catechol 2,3-dioxygenase-like lactoylglutathione lyase family enzyme